MTTSFVWLAAVRPHSDPHVEASGPDIIMRRFGDLGKDHDLAMTSPRSLIQLLSYRAQLLKALPRRTAKRTGLDLPL